MAYAFDRVSQALGGTGDQGQQTDIFNQQPQGGAPKDTQRSDSVQLADNSGSGPSGASSGQSPAAQQPQVSAASRSNLTSKNEGRVKDPFNLSQITSDVSGAKDQLQNEANSYVAGASNLYHNGQLNDQDNTNIAAVAKTGLSADAGQTNDFNALFHGGVQAVDPASFKTNTTFANVPQFSNEAGIASALMQQAGPEYSGGQARLDAGLLNKNAQFAGARDQLENSYQGLQDYRNNMAAGGTQDVQAQAQAARQAAADKWRQAATSGLQGYGDQVVNAGKGAETAFDQALPGLQSDSVEQQMANDQLTKLRGDPLFDPTGQSQQFISNPTNYASYFSNAVTPDQTNWQDFVNSDQANQYNNVMGALGQGSSTLAAGKYAGVDPSTYKGALNFNTSGFNNDVQQAAGNSLKTKQDADKAAAQQKFDADQAAQAQATQATQQQQAAAQQTQADQAQAQAIDKQNKDIPGQLMNPNSGGAQAPGGWDTGPYFHDVTSINQPLQDVSTAIGKTQTGYDKFKKKHKL